MCRKRTGFGTHRRNRKNYLRQYRELIRALKYFIVGLAGQLVSISFACTIGAFSSSSTPSHLPLLWKNRDISNPNQAVYYFTDGHYPYLGLVFADDSSHVWAGINEKGFAIINSNSGNIGPGINSGPDDGEVMKYALQNCASIEEFQQYLDSTNKTGRQTPSNFGVLDTTGEATIFEAGGSSYVRCDASDESLGFMLRANYSMSGDPNNQSGRARYLRGLELAQDGSALGILDAPYIIDKIARDLGGPGFDPYPLPFRGRYGTYPYGFLLTTASLSRYRTRAAVVIVGKVPGVSASSGLMWTILGEPSVGTALPLFYGARATPDLIGGTGLSKICELAKSMRDYVYVGTDFGINTFLLAPVHEKILPGQAEIYNQTQEKLEQWQVQNPTAAEILGFEESLVQNVVEVYEQLNQNQEDTFFIDTLGLVVSPNPARKSIKLTLYPEPALRLIRVYNISGRMVDQISIAPRTKVYNWTPRNLSSGIYFLNVEPSQSLKTRFLYIKN